MAKITSKMVLVIAIIVLGGYIIFQFAPTIFGSQKSFGETFSKISQTFNKKNVDISDGISEEALGNLSNLSLSQLQEIQIELSAIKTTENSPENKVVSLYLTLLELEKNMVKLSDLNEKLSDVQSDNACSSLNLFEERKNAVEQSVNLAKEFNDKTNSFVSSYPQENQKSKIKKDIFDIAALNQRKTDLTNSVILLKESCRGL